MDSSKVSATQLMPAPTTVKEIQPFLGAAGYYRRFIKDFSKMLRKSVKFGCTDECQAAFDQLKKVLTEVPVLAYTDFTKPFILSTDASYIGLGAVLEQCQDCEQRPQPIQYASVSLTSAQESYAITEHSQIQTLFNCNAVLACDGSQRA